MPVLTRLDLRHDARTRPVGLRSDRSALAAALARDFPPHQPDLFTKRFVLPNLRVQETHSETRLLLCSPRREQVHVRGPVLAVREISGLDPALPDQCPHAVVDLAEADTQLSCEVALTELRICLQQKQQLVVHVGRQLMTQARWRADAGA